MSSLLGLVPEPACVMPRPQQSPGASGWHSRLGGCRLLTRVNEAPYQRLRGSRIDTSRISRSGGWAPQVAQEVCAAPGVQDPVEVGVAGVAVADQDTAQVRQDATGVNGRSGAVAGVQEGEVRGRGHVQERVPGRGPANVSSAWTTGAFVIRARTAGRKVSSNRRAALPRKEAAKPVETFIPHSSMISRVERPTGRWWSRTASATFGVISGPYWAADSAPGGKLPVCRLRQPGQRLTSAAYSVTTTGAGTGTSNT